MPEFGEEQQFPKRTAPYSRRMGDDPFRDVKVSCTGEAADFLENKLSTTHFEYDGAGRMRLKSSLYAGACTLINELENRLVTCTANPDEITGEPNLISDGDCIKYPSFTSGFQGANAIVNFSTGYGEFENLFVRGRLTVWEMIINRLHYQCGGLIIGPGGGKIKSVSGTAGTEKIFFEDPDGNNILPFTVGAIILIQDFDLDRTTVIKRLVRQVKAIDGQEIEMEATAGWVPGIGNDDTGAFTAGDEVVAIGHVSNSNLDACIYFSAVDSDNPFMRVFDGVDSYAKWSLDDKSTVILQLGELESLAGYSIVPVSPGVGMYGKNVYLTGHIIISNPENINTTTLTNDAEWTDDTAASAAQATADGKIVTFFQADIPTATDAGDLWVHTGDKNKLYRSTAAGDNEIKPGEWELVRDTDIAQAIADALAAQTDATSALGLIPNDATGLIDFVAAPTGAGLYLGSTHLGYYDGAAWKTYMANNGDFFLGGTSGYLTWVAATNVLTVSGTINSTDGNIGGWAITATALTGGSEANTIALTPGTGIHMGNATFVDAPFSVTNTGILKAESGTIGGFTITSTALTGGAAATTVALTPGVGIHMGAAVFADAPFSVTNAGVLKAFSGNIGGWAMASDALYTGTKHTGDGYSTTGITFVSDGSIHAPYFYINTEGEIGIKQVEEMLFKPDGSSYGIKITGNDIWEDSLNGNFGPVRVNRVGYHGGTTYFRDFQVFDGKGNLLTETGTLGLDIFTTLRVKNAFLTDVTVVTGAPKTIGNDEYMIICNNAAGMTIYLPASPVDGQVHIIKRGAAGVVTVDGNGRSMQFNTPLTSHSLGGGASITLVYSTTYGKWAVVGDWKL